jgi:hypothetical protein
MTELGCHVGDMQVDGLQEFAGIDFLTILLIVADLLRKVIYRHLATRSELFAATSGEAARYGYTLSWGRLAGLVAARPVRGRFNMA